MSEIVMAVYENGVLRPLSPLNLHEHQTVRIQVLAEKSSTEAEETFHILVAAGLIRPSKSGDRPPDPVSEEERRRLAMKLGQATDKPLSDIIIEDRGDW